MKLNKQPILPGFENGIYERRPTFDRAELEAQSPMRDPVRRGNHINVRLSTGDLEQLQKLSLHEGVPLASLIASIVRSGLQSEEMEKRLSEACAKAGTGLTTGGGVAAASGELNARAQSARKANASVNTPLERRKGAVHSG